MPKKSHWMNIFLILFCITPILNYQGVSYPDSVASKWVDPFEDYPLEYNATLSYEDRKATFLNISAESERFYAQATRIYLNQSVNEAVILQDIEAVNNYEDTSDFDVNGYLRMLYLNNRTNVLSTSLIETLNETLLHFKYWIDEPTSPESPSSRDMYFWTENHMILFHTAELLVGQLFRNTTFPYSGMTGQDHIDHAIPLVDRWIKWRAQFGFSEWQSNIYMTLDLVALLNLVEFAENMTIVNKASMLLDLMALGFSNNFFGSRYGTAHGRSADDLLFGTSAEDPASSETPALSAWLMLGIGELRSPDGGNRGAVSIATSDRYTPAPILEMIANASKTNIEHKEQNSLNLEDGPSYGIDYNMEDLMFWWGASATASSPIIDLTLDLMETYDLSPKLVFNDELFLTVLNIGAGISGTGISDYCQKLRDITQGVVLESASFYTYRTPYYQLSGVQDYQKGMNGIQEHLWQATLGYQAMVYTNSPGGVSPREFCGGWKPRATMYKNVGIFQYDRRGQDLLGEAIIMFLGAKPYTHAYFPQWAFDEVVQTDGWTFGQLGYAYVGLYSDNPTHWLGQSELRSSGKKNAYIIELGSIDDYSSFSDFQEQISSASIKIKHLPIGYEIEYHSPIQGIITVSWDGDMIVDGSSVDLGPYPRIDNEYCQQAFGEKNATITFTDESNIQYTYTMDFDSGERIYTQVEI